MHGVTIKLKPVAKAPEYIQAIFRDATLEACDNCKTMMKHANIVYHDWYHQSVFYTFVFPVIGAHVSAVGYKEP
jgi:hypothetical protein